MGSRHIANAPATLCEGKTWPASLDAARGILGPVVIPGRRRVRVGHPEHAGLDLPRGTYQVIHQTDPRTRAAVQD